MNTAEFESLLAELCSRLTAEATASIFTTSPQFEGRVRDLTAELLRERYGDDGLINFSPHPHGFPDVGVGEFGIEVKFTTGDTWRSVANSVLETNRVDDVEHIYVVFGKMGGTPEVRFRAYDTCVVHVRTSHVPRFEVDVTSTESLFDTMGISYEEFRVLEMHQKMEHIRG